MGNHIGHTTTIKRNGTIELTQQVSVMLGHIGSAMTTTFLTDCEDVVRRLELCDELHEDGDTCTIVIAKDNVSPGNTIALTGRATSAGNLCVRVYDIGFVPATSSSYELLIDHY